jgi:hypothetical protein
MQKRARCARPLIAIVATAVIVLSLSATGPDLPIGQAGAGRGDECVASIDPIDVSNRDELGVGDILTSTSPAERD